MGAVAAQVSLYPLRQASIGSPVREAVRVFRQHGLETRMGEMSTLVWGEEGALFAALQEAFHQAAESGDAVMVVTLSNACPEPEPKSPPWARAGSPGPSRQIGEGKVRGETDDRTSAKAS